jgi:hypothetical protein
VSVVEAEVLRGLIVGDQGDGPGRPLSSRSAGVLVPWWLVGSMIMARASALAVWWAMPARCAGSVSAGSSMTTIVPGGSVHC